MSADVTHNDGNCALSQILHGSVPQAYNHWINDSCKNAERARTKKATVEKTWWPPNDVSIFDKLNGETYHKFVTDYHRNYCDIKQVTNSMSPHANKNAEHFDVYTKSTPQQQQKSCNKHTNTKLNGHRGHFPKCGNISDQVNKHHPYKCSSIKYSVNSRKNINERQVSAFAILDNHSYTQLYDKHCAFNCKNADNNENDQYGHNPEPTQDYCHKSHPHHTKTVNTSEYTPIHSTNDFLFESARIESTINKTYDKAMRGGTCESRDGKRNGKCNSTYNPPPSCTQSRRMSELISIMSQMDNDSKSPMPESDLGTSFKEIDNRLTDNSQTEPMDLTFKTSNSSDYAKTNSGIISNASADFTSTNSHHTEKSPVSQTKYTPPKKIRSILQHLLTCPKQDKSLEHFTCYNQSCACTSVPKSQVQITSESHDAVRSRIYEWLGVIINFAVSLPEFSALPVKDRLNLLLGSWSRILLLVMAKENFTFDVTLADSDDDLQESLISKGEENELLPMDTHCESPSSTNIQSHSSSNDINLRTHSPLRDSHPNSINDCQHNTINDSQQESINDSRPEFCLSPNFEHQNTDDNTQNESSSSSHLGLHTLSENIPNNMMSSPNLELLSQSDNIQNGLPSSSNCGVQSLLINMQHELHDEGHPGSSGEVPNLSNNAQNELPRTLNCEIQSLSTSDTCDISNANSNSLSNLRSILFDNKAITHSYVSLVSLSNCEPERTTCNHSPLEISQTQKCTHLKSQLDVEMKSESTIQSNDKPDILSRNNFDIESNSISTKRICHVSRSNNKLNSDPNKYNVEFNSELNGINVSDSPPDLFSDGHIKSEIVSDDEDVTTIEPCESSSGITGSYVHKIGSCLDKIGSLSDKIGPSLAKIGSSCYMIGSPNNKIGLPSDYEDTQRKNEDKCWSRQIEDIVSLSVRKKRLSEQRFGSPSENGSPCDKIGSPTKKNNFSPIENKIGLLTKSKIASYEDKFWLLSEEKIRSHSASKSGSYDFNKSVSPLENRIRSPSNVKSGSGEMEIGSPWEENVGLLSLNKTHNNVIGSPPMDRIDTLSNDKLECETTNKTGPSEIKTGSYKSQIGSTTNKIWSSDKTEPYEIKTGSSESEIGSTNHKIGSSDETGSPSNKIGSLTEIPTQKTVEDIRLFIEKCQTLELDSTQYTLLKMYMLFNTDLSSVSEKQKISAICEKIQRCLWQHTVVAHGDGVKHYSKLLLCLPLLYSINSRMMETLFSLRVDHNDVESILEKMNTPTTGT